MKILGIETSCDETAAAVIEDGRVIHSNVVASQAEIHARFGGIVPEVASRQHLLTVVPVVKQALQDADTELHRLDGVAVTHGPGLAGSLLIGVNAAKGLALGHELPLIGVNHLEGHIYAAWLEDREPEETPGFPLICLIASGGHTDLVLMEGHGRFTLVARTRDDAAGEVFDKAARVLGLGFPGGPEIQRVSATSTGQEPRFPRPRGEKLPRLQLQRTQDGTGAASGTERYVPCTDGPARGLPGGGKRGGGVSGGDRRLHGPAYG